MGIGGLVSLLEVVDGRAGAGVGAVDGEARAAAPVVARGGDIRAAEVVAGEPKVAGAEAAVALEELVVERGDVRVVADTTAGVAAQVAAEAVQAGVELLENDGLALDLADLLSDNALGHLLENEETLLDDFDRLRAANELLLLDNGDLTRAEVAVVEIAVAVEVVERAHRTETAPVIKVAGRAAGNDISVFGGKRGTRDGVGEGRKSDDDDGGKFGEHDD